MGPKEGEGGGEGRGYSVLTGATSKHRKVRMNPLRPKF
jgi:hypothetical protein